MTTQTQAYKRLMQCFTAQTTAATLTSQLKQLGQTTAAYRVEAITHNLDQLLVKLINNEYLYSSQKEPDHDR